MHNQDSLESRYQRQLLLPEIGEAGQERLRSARVLLIGVGGLGSPIASYLTGAGVGVLGIVDDDKVSLTNLHRQVLYGESLLGRSKAEEAHRRLSDLNNEVKVQAYPCRLTRENAQEIFSGYDLVLDGCDNFATRFLIDDMARVAGIPYIYGAVRGFEGQAAVFGVEERPRYYRNLFPDEAATLAMPHPGKAIVGMTPAVVGSVMAVQAVLLLCGLPSPLAGKLWTIDLRTMQTFLVEI